MEFPLYVISIRAAIELELIIDVFSTLFGYLGKDMLDESGLFNATAIRIDYSKNPGEEMIACPMMFKYIYI
jgi:hypothetical protein